MPFICRCDVDSDEFKRRIDKLEGDFLELRLDLMLYLRELNQQIKEIKEVIEEAPRPARRPPDTGQLLNAEMKTAVLIEKFFNMDELITLMLDFGVSYEKIKGSTIDVKAREFAGYMNRRGKLGKLVKRCIELRPDAYGWPIEIIEEY